MTIFSVIVPVFNIQDHISQCVRSILDQSFMNFELILVNDGSTDSSGMICDGFTNNGRVRVIHKENGGLSDARNTGIANARGDYLIFVDGDDYIEQDALEKIHKGIEEAKAPDVLVTRIRRIFDDGSIRNMDPDLPIKLLKEGRKEDHIKWIFGRSDNTWPSVRYVVKRQFIVKHGLAFAKGYLHEDLDWTSRLFLYAETFSCLDLYWYNHRKGREGAITSSPNPKRLLDVIEIAASNIRNGAYNDMSPELREIIFKRLVRSVFSQLSDYKFFNRKGKNQILNSLDRNKSIFKYEYRYKHRFFISFCKVFGFRTGLFLLKYIQSSAIFLGNERNR